MKFNKSYRKVLLVLVSIFICLKVPLAQQSIENDFSYRPYPVILVHGFGSAPGESWGAVTKKDKNQDEIISTRMLDTATMNSDISFGRDLIQSYDNFPGYKDTLDLYFDRFIPYEEEGSYSGINHTYVETYCSYYRYESNDGKGEWHPEFSISGAPAGQYDISEGGQTQLLRIRIIQTLNEYYGDFKWVNDPSAKITKMSESGYTG